MVQSQNQLKWDLKRVTISFVGFAVSNRMCDVSKLILSNVWTLHGQRVACINQFQWCKLFPLHTDRKHCANQMAYNVTLAFLALTVSNRMCDAIKVFLSSECKVESCLFNPILVMQNPLHTKMGIAKHQDHNGALSVQYMYGYDNKTKH